MSPRTQSASGFCPGGHNPLAGTVQGDKIRQRILSGGTYSASGFCPSSAECVPPPPPPPLQQLINPLRLISERVGMQLRMVKWSPNAQIHINFTRKLEMLQSNHKSVSQSHAQEEQHHLSSCSVGKCENTNTFDKEPFVTGVILHQVSVSGVRHQTRTININILRDRCSV